ncbi:uncharacterized protein LOC103890548 [Pongo abelii]|uniref:uncharacterized protein LOC103890548 n=1 Tax=Pongo abelii TaxID=9601 RepID=UPI0023E8245F|nr:uncharacterized protein LOC103890548 [Pongo abelii]
MQQGLSRVWNGEKGDCGSPDCGPRPKAGLRPFQAPYHRSLGPLHIEIPDPEKQCGASSKYGGKNWEPLAPSAPLWSRNPVRLCVTSARGVIYLPWASVNMTNFHRGQKAFLRQSILERSLTQ